MELSAEQRDGVMVIGVDAARIDAASAIRFKDRMRELTEGTTGRIVLDLAKVDFIDSSGLGAIVAALKQLGKDQKLELAALSPTVAKVFQLTRLDSVFKLHETLADALKEPPADE